MIETFTIITLSVLYLIFFRPGKTPPLDSPLVIERPGSHHMTLVNKLNLAQPFIEAIAAQTRVAGDAGLCSATLCFEVRDKQVKAHGHDCYLLALTKRDGILYCQAISPQASGSHLNAMMEFAEGVLRRFPATGAHSDELDARIVAAVREAAERRAIDVKKLSG
jgi:hypothetical protein